MKTETYILKVIKTEEGVTIEEFQENNSFSEFELMGILFHLQQEHSKKLSKDLLDYEQSKLNG